MIYRPKKDFWLVGLVWGSVLLVVSAGALVCLTPGGDAKFGRELVISGVLAGVTVLVLTYPLEYELAGGQLVARSGVMRWRVPLAAVEEVAPHRSYASAPAWSINRLRVAYREDAEVKFLYIAPADRARFLADLAGAAPGLERRDDRVVRVA